MNHDVYAGMYAYEKFPRKNVTIIISFQTLKRTPPDLYHLHLYV